MDWQATGCQHLTWVVGFAVALGFQLIIREPLLSKGVEMK
jgi:hypothetical protein